MIRFYNISKIKYLKKNQVKFKNFLIKKLESFFFKTGDIFFYLISDEEMYNLNFKTFGKKYYTDVITFNLNIENIISCESYLSYNRILENSKKFNLSVNNEFYNLVIHSILHLIDYDDNNSVNRKIMFKTQKEWLNEFLYSLK